MEYTNLIQTDIVDSKYDVFWEGMPDGSVAEPKPVLIIVNNCEQESAEDAQLKKMLEACQLTDHQYHILRFKNGQQVAWHQLRDQLNPKVIFMIGVFPAQLGIAAHFRLNEPNSFNDCLWLPTIDIQEQEQRVEMKKQLWTNGMKPLFVDKKFGEF